MTPSSAEQSEPSDILYRRIARGSLVVGLFVLLAGNARGGLEVFIAWRYGTSGAVDAYYFVLNMVSWPISIWFSALTFVLVPLFAKIRREAPGDLRGFGAELLGAAIVVSLIVTALLFAGLELLFRTNASGLSAETREVAIWIARVFWLLVPFGFLIGLLSAQLIAENRHVGTLLEAVPAIVVIGVLLVYGGHSFEPVVWGTVAGFAARLLLLRMMLHERDYARQPTFRVRSPWWGAFVTSCGVIVLGQALMAVTVVVDQFFAAHHGAGSVASLNYANRVLALVLFLGATSIQRASLPIFSTVYAENDVKFGSVIRDWALIMVAVGLIAVILAWLVAPAVIALLFERGAFTSTDSAAVTSLFRFGLVQAPAYFGGMVFVSALASTGRHGPIALAAIFGLIVKCLANAVLSRWLYLEGIQIATALMYLATFIFLLFVVRRL